MSEIASQVGTLQDKNKRISDRLVSIENTMSNSYGEMQIKINRVASEMNKITTNTIPNLSKSRGDVLQLKEKVLTMSDEIETISTSVDQMKDNTLMSSQLDPIKDGMNKISTLSSQIVQLKDQIGSIKKVTDVIERRDNWMDEKVST